MGELATLRSSDGAVRSNDGVERSSMTEIEAKDWLKAISCTTIDGVHKEQRKEALFIGMQALEKQIAKKPYVLPINREENFTYCPNCKRNGTLVTPSYVYCTKCGQKLDWGNENDT